jgi:leucyl/phenylalanyl-tRNA--protein transferase
VDYHLRGDFPIEREDGLYSYVPYFREIIPLGLRLPHGIVETIRKKNFLFTINQDFERVMDICARPRHADDEPWIRGRMKEFLNQLHQINVAHSFEAYNGDELMGGILGLQIGALFVTLSIFGKNGGGYAICAVLQHVLHDAGVRIHDAVRPSTISEFFHGGLRLLRTDRDIRETAAATKVHLPVISAKIPVASYLGIPQPK